MKLIPIFLGLAVLTARVGLAQGFLGARNQNTTPLLIRTPDYVTHLAGALDSPLAPGSVIVTLWIATNGAPPSELVEVARGTDSTSPLPGAAGTFDLGNPLVLPAPWDGTFPVELLYRAWWATTGATWEEALAATPVQSFFPSAGQTPLLTGFALGSGSQPPPETFGPGLLQGLTISVPEPTTPALLGAGILALLVLRRRKAGR